jgi:hypothetical protein
MRSNHGFSSSATSSLTSAGFCSPMSTIWFRVVRHLLGRQRVAVRAHSSAAALGLRGWHGPIP